MGALRRYGAPTNRTGRIDAQLVARGDPRLPERTDGWLMRA